MKGGANLKYVKFGSTSIETSAIGLGTWAIGGWAWGGTDEKNLINAVNGALESGVNLIDTAPMYGKGLSEEIIGKAIKGKRDKVVLATKCGLIWHTKAGVYFFDYESTGEKVYKYLKKESIEYELNNSLKRLGTDYIDLYQTHWQDSTTPIEEIMEALLTLKDKGKIRAIGVCNASFEELKEYERYGKFDTNQGKYSLLDRNIENEIMPWCIGKNISIIAYGSLSKGMLTGKLRADRKFKNGDHRIGKKRFSVYNIAKTNDLIVKFLKPVADKHNCSIGNIATAWLLKNPRVIALCGARNEKQAIENAAGADIKLDESDLEEIKSFINNYEETD